MQSVLWYHDEMWYKENTNGEDRTAILKEDVLEKVFKVIGYHTETWYKENINDGDR